MSDEQADEFEGADSYYEGQIKSLRDANAHLVKRLSAARAGTALLDRMQETRIFVLPGGERGVICGGRFDGWLCWRHPDGQFVTLEKLKAEAPRSLFNEPQEG